MTNEELLLAMSDMMDAKLKPVHVKMDRMDRRLGKVEKRLEKLEGRMSRLEESVIRLEERVGSLENRVGKLEDKVGKLDDRAETLESRVRRIEIDLLENGVMPRLNTIEAFYVETSKRYQESTDHMEAVRADVSVLKLVVQDHSKKLQAI